MLDTFNCGLGMVVAMAPDHAEKNIAAIAKHKLDATVVGKVVPRDGGAAVRYEGELKL
jgi:phosphoribosylformylglycinamidine cyclo-ligase